MVLLSDSELENLLTPLQLVNAVERAMISDELKENFVPQRMHLNHAGNTYLLMPAYGKDSFGTKLVSVVPENSKSGLPVISGLYSLNDARTGAVLSLMNASRLTALRTGAIAAVAVRALSSTDTETIGIIGPGLQAEWIAICIAAIIPLKKIYVLGRSKNAPDLFKQKIQKRLPEVEVVPVQDSTEILKNTSVIITATTSDVPVLPEDTSLLKGKKYIAMGSYRKDMRELPDALFKLSGCILTDAPGTRHEVGDVVHPVQMGFVKETDVFTLGSIFTGRNLLLSDTVIFKSAGYALFDLFVAQQLYDSAINSGKGTDYKF